MGVTNKGELKTWYFSSPDISFYNLHKTILLCLGSFLILCKLNFVQVFIFSKSLIWGTLSFQYILIALNLAYNQNKLYKTSDYWWRMFKLNFSEKNLRLVSPLHFVYDFWGKVFLMLYSINWPNFLVWLPLLLEILGNMCITIVCWPGCDVIRFETNLIFLIKPFFYKTKKSRQKLKYLENKNSFWGEIKYIFHDF